MFKLEVALNSTRDSAPGPDGHKYRIFKEMLISSQNKMLQLYNQVSKEGMRPKSWKLSNVIPYFQRLPMQHLRTRLGP